MTFPQSQKQLALHPQSQPANRSLFDPSPQKSTPSSYDFCNSLVTLELMIRPLQALDLLLHGQGTRIRVPD